MYKFAISTTILIGLIQPLKAQRYVASPGSEAYYKVVRTLNAPQIHDTAISIWRVKVSGVSDSSIALECTLKSYQMGVHPPTFTTDDPNHYELNNSLAIENLMILDRPFGFEMKRTANTEQPDLQKIIEERIAAWEIDENIAPQMRQNQQFGPYGEIRPMFAVLPTAIKSLPATWTYPDNTIRYTITEASARSINIKSEQAVRNGQDSVGYQHANYALNPANGMIISAELNTITDQQQNSFTITQVSPNEAHPMSEDIRTAIVLPSFFSHALKNTVGYDSAKTSNYFARFDRVLGGQNFYKLIKLDLLMHNLRSNMIPYDSLLLATPDTLIANNTIHLFNKAQHVLKRSPDSAYSVIRYLSRFPKDFRSWVQESYAQNWIDLPMDEIKTELKKEGFNDTQIDSIMNEALKGRAVATKTFEKLLDDKDSNIQHEIYPLSLWVESKKHATNKDSLLQIARQLEKLSDDKKYSNPHRYSLLVYKELLAAGATTDADKVLDFQIASMLKRVGDSSDNDRFADQNMLAYAYKLKSDAVKVSNPKASMDFLSKAAKYSPKNSSENPYTSFYDRAFLSSQETYRPEFAEALLKQGESKEGMLLLSEQVNADPGFFEELQKAFAKNYPQMDFYRFFNEVVVKSWKKAPDFTLKSPDGKTTYKLSDYRGKWLLVDFWGTWCGPCREEMPKINEFVQKINGRKDLAFLSIASHDRPAAVTAFLNERQYHLPVCMSDNEIDGKFGVTGYPGKFLISPTGSVQPIDFGKDWAKIVDQISALKPKQTKPNQQPSKLQNQKKN